jgi:hypothetical protein
MQKAKYAARLTLTHAALAITSFWNETFQTQLAHWGIGVLRNTFSADPIDPTQPEPVYYVFRTLSTVLEGVRPAELEVRFSADSGQLEHYTLRRGQKERLVAVWIPGAAGDGAQKEVKTDILLPGVKVSKATAIDVLNGETQELTITSRGSDTLLQGMHLRDWPLVITLEHALR